VTGLGDIAIVGAGQVGTALGMALRQARASAGVGEIALRDRDAAVSRRSLARGAADRILDRPEDALAFGSVVLALPVPEIVAFLDTFGPRLESGQFVIDTGSAKAAVVEAMRRSVPRAAHAIGGHPIAGTERAGPEGADPDTLRGAAFALCPVRDDPTALARGRALAAAVGARAHEIDAATHDRVMARLSGLAHLSAYALARVAGSLDAGAARPLVGSGFRGATRLAASDPAMVAGFLAAIAPEAKTAATELQAALAGLAATLDREEDLRRWLAGAQRARERLA